MFELMTWSLITIAVCSINIVYLLRDIKKIIGEKR
jgi:hypothetical protein